MWMSHGPHYLYSVIVLAASYGISATIHYVCPMELSDRVRCQYVIKWGTIHQTYSIPCSGNTVSYIVIYKTTHLSGFKFNNSAEMSYHMYQTCFLADFMNHSNAVIYLSGYEKMLSKINLSICHHVSCEYNALHSVYNQNYPMHRFCLMNCFQMTLADY